MVGGLCLFLFGMKIMSEGLQQGAGDRMRKALNFMTGNRFVGVLTGLVVTGIIQSSSAVTVMVVSFVNAGLLTLTQSIGVIMGANIGTTVTAWIVSLIGFSPKISQLAWPTVGIGFILTVFKKYKSLGEFLLGFGLLFLGLQYLTQGMSSINEKINFSAIAIFSNSGYITILVGFGAGLLMTLLIHSSSASTAIIITMAFNKVITYEMAAGMVLGANVGTTIDAILAAIGTSTAAKRTALVHVLFNILGTIWALPLLGQLLRLVDFITPGAPEGFGITTHIAMLHTVFNILNTIIFLPFVNQYSRLVSFIIRDKKPKEESGHYKFAYHSAAIVDSPELNILRVEKEIHDMTGIACSMFAPFGDFLRNLGVIEDKENAATELCKTVKQKEEYVDEMMETLTSFLIECTRERLNKRTEQRVSHLLQVISDIEQLSDDCYGICLLLEKNIRKNRIFSEKETEALLPYINQIGEFLELPQKQSGQSPALLSIIRNKEYEVGIKQSRKKLQKLSRKRIEAGKDIKTELFFIDLIKSVEKIGNACYGIVSALIKM